MADYGKEVIIDLENCNIDQMQREQVKEFCYGLCKEIDMIPMSYYDWEKEGIDDAEWAENPHLQGVSACLFIKTSSITVHAIYGLKKVFINCFSCKDFDIDKAVQFAITYFQGNVKAAGGYTRY